MVSAGGCITLSRGDGQKDIWLELEGKREDMDELKKAIIVARREVTEAATCCLLTGADGFSGNIDIGSAETV